MTVIDGASVQSVPYDAPTVEDDQATGTADAVGATSAADSELEALVASSEVVVAKSDSKTSAAVSTKLVEALTSVVVALVGLLTTIFSKTKSSQSKDDTSDAPVTTKNPPPSSTSTGGASTSSSGSTKPPSSGSQSGAPTPVPASGNKDTSPTKGIATHLSAIRDDSGAVTVRTPDGYIVKAEGKQHAWSITDPDGKATRIFGDPHVKESDGDAWDFKARGTFFFGKNKVTVETLPASNGTTVSRQITVYSGKERVTVGGLDKNEPTILALAEDGKQHDDSLNDGTIYRRGGTSKGENWSTEVKGKKVIMGGKR